MSRRVNLLTALSLVLSASTARAEGEKPNCYIISAGIDVYASPNVKNLKG